MASRKSIVGFGRDALSAVGDGNGGDDPAGGVSSVSTSPTAAMDVGVPTEFNPLHWPRWRKWTYVAILSYCDSLVFFINMMIASSIPAMLATFDSAPEPSPSTKTLGSFVVTSYILGFTFGPLEIGPLSDLYGRARVFRVAMVGFAAVTLAAAWSPSLGGLIAFRFVAGIFASAPMTIGGAVVADMYPEGGRRGAMTAFKVGTTLAPTLGPVLGGLITLELGWRWTLRIAGILAAAGTVMVFTIPESDFDTIKRRLAVTAPVADGESRGERRDPFLKRRHAMSTITFRQALLLVWTPISMAARVLFTFTSTALIGLVYFLFMGVSDTVLSSLGTVMHVRYGFSTLHAGLMYLGLGFGCVAAVFLGLPLNDLFVKWRRKRQIRDAKSLRVHVTKRDEGVAEKGDLTDGDMSPVVPDSPLSSSDKRETEVAGQAQGEGTMEKKIMKTTDDEVWFMVTMMPLLPVGMMIYGWTLQSDAHWFVPLIGLFIIGFSFMTILIAMQIFYVEAVPGYAGSALAASTIAQSVGGALIPLATWSLIDGVGFGLWGVIEAAIALLALALLVGMVIARRLWPEEFRFEIDLASKLKGASGERAGGQLGPTA